jgi:hypothetical protein
MATWPKGYVITHILPLLHSLTWTNSLQLLIKIENYQIN